MFCWAKQASLNYFSAVNCRRLCARDLERCIHFTYLQMENVLSKENPNWEVDPQNRHPKLIMLDENNLKHILEESTCERDLGVLIDNRLRWQPQINIAKSKGYASLGSLKRAIKHWTPIIFKILYTAFVRPHLEFCSSFW